MKPLVAFVAVLFLLAASPFGLYAEDDPPREDGPMVTFDFAEKDIREAIQFISQASRVNIVVSPEVSGDVTLNLRRVAWRRALELVVAQVNGRIVEAAPNLLRVERMAEDDPRRPDSHGQGGPSVSLTFVDEDVRNVIRVIAEFTQTNMILSPAVEGRVSVSLHDVPWRQALEQIVAMVGGAVVEEDFGILRIVPRAEAERTSREPASTGRREGDGRRVTYRFVDEDVRKVIQAIARFAGANIILSPEIEGTVTLSVREVPWRAALEQVVHMVGGVVVEEQGVLRIAPPGPLQLRYFDVKDLGDAARDVAPEVGRTTPGAARETQNGILVVRDTEAQLARLARELHALRSARGPAGAPEPPPPPRVVRPAPDDRVSPDVLVVQIHHVADVRPFIADLEARLARVAPEAHIVPHGDTALVVKALPADQEAIAKALRAIRAELRAEGIDLPEPPPPPPVVPAETPEPPRPPEPPHPPEFPVPGAPDEEDARRALEHAMQVREVARRQAEMRARLAELETRLALARERYTERHPHVIQLVEKVHALRARLAALDAPQLPTEAEWELASRGTSEERILEAVLGLRREVEALRSEIREIKELLEARDR
ncbi:MAG: hypothetical protein ACYTG6_01260 [Planctomycetota bacterium]|jgi:hypothetical protein